jgi:hypothetical protein
MSHAVLRPHCAHMAYIHTYAHTTDGDDDRHPLSSVYVAALFVSCYRNACIDRAEKRGGFNSMDRLIISVIGHCSQRAVTVGCHSSRRSWLLFVADPSIDRHAHARARTYSTKYLYIYMRGLRCTAHAQQPPRNTIQRTPYTRTRQAVRHVTAHVWARGTCVWKLRSVVPLFMSSRANDELRLLLKFVPVFNF